MDIFFSFLYIFCFLICFSGVPPGFALSDETSASLCNANKLHCRGYVLIKARKKREHLDGAPFWRACFKEQRQLLLYGYILFVFVYCFAFWYASAVCRQVSPYRTKLAHPPAMQTSCIAGDMCLLRRAKKRAPRRCSRRACFKEQRQLLLYGYILFVFVYCFTFWYASAVCRQVSPHRAKLAHTSATPIKALRGISAY